MPSPVAPGPYEKFHCCQPGRPGCVHHKHAHQNGWHAMATNEDGLHYGTRVLYQCGRVVSTGMPWGWVGPNLVLTGGGGGAGDIGRRKRRMFGCSFLWISCLICPSSPSPPLCPPSIFPSSPAFPLSLLCLSSAFPLPFPAFPSPFLSFLRLPRSFLSAFPLPAFPLPFLGLSFIFPSFLLRLSFVYLSGKRGVVAGPQPPRLHISPAANDATNHL